MLKIFIFSLAVSGVFSLKCYICKNADDPLCFELENSNGKFLRECARGETECAVLQERSTDPYITRMCVTPSWRCDDAKFKCAKCETDACNIENEVKPSKITNIIAPRNHMVDLLRANSTAIGVVSLLIVLPIIWCAIRCYAKKDEVENEDEDEDDYEQYYENETNIDLE